MGSTVEATRSYTPEDLLRLPGNRYELEDGQLTERNVSIWSSYVAGVIFHILNTYVTKHGLGWVFPENTSFQCFADKPDRVRRPDGAFIRLRRLSVERAKLEGHGSLVPDLVLEVLSPNDIAYEVDQRVRLYLTAGVLLVWVVNPEQETMEIHRKVGPGTILGANDEVSGEDVLPGFRRRVGDFFLPPKEAPLTSAAEGNG